jgi:hypothetical protein
MLGEYSPLLLGEGLGERCKQEFISGYQSLLKQDKQQHNKGELLQ